MSERIFVSRTTGAVALSTTVSPAAECQILSVSIHLGSASATAENLTITLDSLGGAAYDVVLDAQDMNTVADYIWQPSTPFFLANGDALALAWANSNTETYGLEVRWKR